MLGCVLDSAYHGVGAVSGSFNPVMELGVWKEEAGIWGNEGCHDVFHRNVRHSSDRTQGRPESLNTWSSGFVFACFMARKENDYPKHRG
jgi:hypothetical protein